MNDQVRIRVCDAIEKRVGVSCRHNNHRTCFAGLGKIVVGGKQPSSASGVNPIAAVLITCL